MLVPTRTAGVARKEGKLQQSGGSLYLHDGVTAGGNEIGGGGGGPHSHGNITNAGAIGSTADLPVITTTSGVLTTGAFGTGATNFCAGNDSRLSDARTPTAHNQAWSTITSTPTTLAGYGITDAQGLDTQLTSIAGLSYTGNSLKVVRVNAGETAFELATASSSSGTIPTTAAAANFLPAF